jgi:hypothetical protein
MTIESSNEIGKKEGNEHNLRSLLVMPNNEVPRKTREAISLLLLLPSDFLLFTSHF